MKDVEMEYETVSEAAIRLGVTSRAVQKWAASGKITGAIKEDGVWKLPKATVVLENVAEPLERGYSEEVEDVYSVAPFRNALPLLTGSYSVGRGMEYINAIEDIDDRNIALSEYYFFRGNSEQAIMILEPYLDSHDPSLRYSANLITTFANLMAGHIHRVRFSMDNIKEQVGRGLRTKSPKKLHALGVMTATTLSVLFHTPVVNLPPLENYLKFLEGGVKLWACYILAHKAYIEGDYNKCLSISELSIALAPSTFSIATVYIHITAAIALVNMKKTKEAGEHIREAWRIAEPDGLLAPFAQHYGLLGGMIEIFFKKDYPREFKDILDMSYSFGSGWRKIHNHDNKRDVADNLLGIEFVIAMLYSRGWTYKEIANHLQISERSVSNRISDIFTKLGVNNRKSLIQFMLY